MQKPHAEKGETCPFNQMDVSKVCHKCPLYIQLRGLDPQTGEPVDKWACSIALLPVLMIENSQQQRQTGAAVESFRNEMVKANRETAEAMVNTALFMSQNVKTIKGN